MARTNIFSFEAFARLLVTSAGNPGYGYMSASFISSVEASNPAVDFSEKTGVILKISDMDSSLRDIVCIYQPRTGDPFGNEVDSIMIYLSGTDDTWPYGDAMSIVINGTSYPITGSDIIKGLPGTDYHGFRWPAGKAPSFQKYETVVGDNANNEFDDTAHGFVDGDRVEFSATTMPDGLNEERQYFVINANANDFQIARYTGGNTTVVPFTSNGTAVVCHKIVQMGCKVDVNEVLGAGFDVLNNLNNDAGFNAIF